MTTLTTTHQAHSSEVDEEVITLTPAEEERIALRMQEPTISKEESFRRACKRYNLKCK